MKKAGLWTRNRESRFRNIYLLHGRGGRRDGTVARLEQILGPGYPDVKFHRPPMPHSNPDVAAENSLDYLANQFLPFIQPGSLVVGISLGGLIAAKLQESHPGLFEIFTLVTPTSCDDVRLEKKMDQRVSLYSTKDVETQGRCENWPELTDLAFDVPWLQHDVDLAKYACCYLISCYMRGLDMRHEVETLFPEIKEENTNEPYTV